MITEEELKDILGKVQSVKDNDPEMFNNCIEYLKTLKES